MRFCRTFPLKKSRKFNFSLPFAKWPASYNNMPYQISKTTNSVQRFTFSNVLVPFQMKSYFILLLTNKDTLYYSF